MQDPNDVNFNCQRYTYITLLIITPHLRKLFILKEHFLKFNPKQDIKDTCLLSAKVSEKRSTLRRSENNERRGSMKTVDND